MRIAIMGAGGVGGYLGGRLQAAGEDVTFIARGANLAALHRDGLLIRSPAGDLHLPQVRASADPARVGAVDLVLFCVKLWDTDAAAAALGPLLGADGRVLTLQNGIDSVALLSRRVPRERILAGSVYMTAHLAQPGVVVTPGGPCRIVAEEHGGDPVVAAFAAACGRAQGIDVRLDADVERFLWEKFVSLCAMSGATALLRSPLGPILAHPQTRAFVEQLIDEGVALAAAAGHPLAPEYAQAAFKGICRLPAGFRASMAEDLMHGRRLELPWLSGRMHEMGQQLGIATPGHTAVYRGLVLYENGAPA